MNKIAPQKKKKKYLYLLLNKREKNPPTTAPIANGSKIPRGIF